MTSTTSIKIAIFASGAGSNAEKIIEHFQNSSIAHVKLILCNKENAGVLNIAKKNNIKSVLIDKTAFFHSDKYVTFLSNEQIDLIILAGFLWKIPANLIGAFAERIINIHPALLPKYGGKGMYGHFVHEAVIAAHEEKSGITIHLVDELYDHGKHLLQAECTLQSDETPETLAKKIHELEHKYFPKAIEDFITQSIMA
ncbi:MAG TPA: phosphoribosylglycinamide formyltransferase [Arachidicoccus sp.]